MSPSVEILDRSACTVKPDRVELRLKSAGPHEAAQSLATAAHRFSTRRSDAVQDTSITWSWPSPKLSATRGLLHISRFTSISSCAAADPDRSRLGILIANGSSPARRSGVSQSPCRHFLLPRHFRGRGRAPHAGVLADGNRARSHGDCRRWILTVSPHFFGRFSAAFMHTFLETVANMSQP